MEDDNIIFETMPDFRDIKLGSDNIQQTYEDEKEYDSLYDELMDKCNPKKFNIEYFGFDKFDEANYIWSELKKEKEYTSKESLILLRNRAIQKLGVHISTKKKLNELKEYLNPDVYIDDDNYDRDLISKVGKVYEEILSAKNDIILLEEIEKKEVVEEIMEYYSANKLSLEEYLDKYPNGKYSEILKLRLDKEETECFEKESASAYLDKYPNGKYVEEVNYWLENTARKYLKKYLDGRYKGEAEDKIKENKGILLIWGFLFFMGVVFALLSSLT